MENYGMLFSGIFLLIIVVIAITFLVVFFAACFLCAEAAIRRDRSGFGWFLIAFFGTPILAALLLILLDGVEELK